MFNLKRKLAFGYGLLIAIILALSLWNVYGFVRLGRAIDIILVNNYKSILAAENMKEALERQDSAAMFFIAGHAEKGREQFALNAEKFLKEFDIVSNNITEPGEDQIVADIAAKYSAYKQDLERFLNSGDLKFADQSRYYFERLEPSFLILKNRIDYLLHLNQTAMVAASDCAKALSWQAEFTTAILAALALTFALLFTWWFTGYIVDPILKLSEKAKRIGEGDLDQHIDLSSKDEIGLLASEFNRMAARLRDLRQSDYWRMLMERKKSDAVIDSIYEPVIVTDAQGHVTKINQSAAKLLEGWRNGKVNEDISLSGFSAGERITQAVRDAIAMQRPVEAEGESALVPIKVDGAERSFRLRTTPMRDSEGRLIGAVSVLEDITHMRQIDWLKTEFISVASSKMREPLHSLQMALHALVEKYRDELDDQKLDLLYSARNDAEQLDDLMSDLLELTEIESGAKQLSSEPVRPSDLVQSAMERNRAYAESKHVKLESNVPPDSPRVLADLKAIRQIFNNLLSNAIRHTDRDGKVIISAEERGNRVVFSVRDTGEGIPEKYLPNIFDRFVRIEGKPGGGTGLGLALVKRLVEAQGGQVGVESRVGEGTTFTFTIPVVESVSQSQEKLL
jgi:two-component system, NtrC family, sensor histidine kinase KinB